MIVEGRNSGSDRATIICTLLILRLLGLSGIRNAMDLSDVLDQYGVPTVGSEHHHCRDGWIATDCFQCSPGWGKYRLGFEIATGRANCWICGKVDPAEAISSLCGISLFEAIQIIRGTSRGYVHRERSEGRLVLPMGLGELLPAHRAYLEGRGFCPDEISRIWGIRAIGPTGNLKWRIFIPIHDANGRMVSWSSRAISKNAGLRYISAAEDQEIIPHKSILYGAHHVRHSVIICEGPFDAMAVGPGAVACFGLGFSTGQMAAMSNFPRRTIVFDAEPAAQKRALQLCRDLAALPGVTENVELESAKDPADADKSEIAELRARYL